MTTVAIIQARMGSTRLPGKVLMDVAGKPMLLRVHERVARARALDAVVVATSFAGVDQQIVRFCQANGIICLRGGEGENDVLGRYADVARMMLADVIVRITADCPLIDPDIIDAVVALQAETGQPYVNNVDPRTFPDGLDVEVSTVDALREADRETVGEEREHVTPWMRRRWPDGHLQQAAAYLGDLKWSVDTQEELEFVRLVYEALGDHSFAWQEVLNLHD